MAKEKFYKCDICGNFVGMVKNAGVPMVCCGKSMTELIPNTVDAKIEAHVPEVEVNGEKVKVKVGSMPHPMIDTHWITFVYLMTERGGQRKNLNPGEEPAADFVVVGGDKPIAAYAYCNLHGLWKKEI